MRQLITTLSLLFVFTIGYAQVDIKALQNRLDSLVKYEPGLNDTIQISVGDIDIESFLKGVAEKAFLNISVSPDLNFLVSNNFTSVRVSNLLVFIAKTYKLDIEILGNIIYFKKYAEPIVVVAQEPVWKPIIDYDKATDLLSLELKNDNLYSVTKEITRISGKNIILSKELQEYKLTGYYFKMPLVEVLKNIVLSNNLEMVETEQGIIQLSEQPKQPTETSNTSRSNKSSRNKNKNVGGNRSNTGNYDIVVEDSLISLNVTDAPLSEVISDIANNLGASFVLLSMMNETVSLNLDKVTFEDFIVNAIPGKKLGCVKKKGIYIIGPKADLDNKITKILPLQYRNVEKLLEVFPKSMTEDMEIIEFLELNSLVVNGEDKKVREIESFVIQIDQLVPVILIEVLLVDVSKSKSFSAGIQAGLGEGSQKTTGSLFPDVDVNLSTKAINDLINSFNGFGWVKIGHVTPEFYMSIKALEQNGVLKLRSTPKLSTLNGHEASLSIGKTEYYVEEQNNVIGTQNPQNITTRNYKSVSADMALTIKPMISGDNYITLEIDVTQSDFTERISPDAPPGSVNRNFKSIIRVKNSEMILLGGLEENSVTDSGSGFPFLSSIPVIKWLFSNRTKQTSDAKLNIFVKPTIIN